MEMFSQFIRTFLCGGLLCLIGKILIDTTWWRCSSAHVKKTDQSKHLHNQKQPPVSRRLFLVRRLLPDFPSYVIIVPAIVREAREIYVLF